MQGDIPSKSSFPAAPAQAIQRRRPRSHTIVEAHPDVHARMLALGWDKRPGVRIVFGRWQDALPGLGRQFDGVFFDTYSEYYGDMQCAPSPALCGC
jgi:protein arginine N-methyltransferase 2